jgi:hypothetical protein
LIAYYLKKYGRYERMGVIAYFFAKFAARKNHMISAYGRLILFCPAGGCGEVREGAAPPPGD